MAEPIWSFSQAFTTQFQTSHSELKSRVNAAKSSTLSTETLNSLSLELAKLAKSLADATGSIPAYDQKQCELQLKELERAIESLRTSVPKSKFAFKRKANLAGASKTIIPSSAPPQPAQAASQPSSNISSISNQSWKYLTRDAISGSLGQTDLSISDLDSCIVNLVETPTDGNPGSVTSMISKISALHVRNLSNTVLILPAIEGSALLHDLTRCTIVLACHQFRMHTSRSVDVYLSIPSNPIIEHCDRIRFTEYPRSLIRSGDISTSNSFAVQDFSHIRATPSPNWSMFGDGITVEWPLRLLHQKEDIEQALRAVLPS